jgi:endo-1,3-1,4-beta-glycanase ExoK
MALSPQPERKVLTAIVLVGAIIVVVAVFVIWLMRPRPLVIDRGDGRSFIQSFSTELPRDTWAVSNASFRSDFYRAGFSKRNVRTGDGAMRLSIDRRDMRHQPNSGAEVQKRGFYHYGRYEVVMKPARGSGLVSSFFTHTFDLFGDPHDEIDIEFLGNNTRQVSLNCFASGKATGSIAVPLAFDAADAPHLYAFDWRPDRIDWYVDGARVHTVRAETGALPSSPGRVIMNLWTGSEAQYGWHGQPTFTDGTEAVYYCASYRALGNPSGQCSDTFLAPTIKSKVRNLP